MAASGPVNLSAAVPNPPPGAKLTPALGAAIENRLKGQPIIFACFAAFLRQNRLGHLFPPSPDPFAPRVGRSRSVHHKRTMENVAPPTPPAPPRYSDLNVESTQTTGQSVLVAATTLKSLLVRARATTPRIIRSQIGMACVLRVKDMQKVDGTLNGRASLTHNHCVVLRRFLILCCSPDTGHPRPAGERYRRSAHR